MAGLRIESKTGWHRHWFRQRQRAAALGLWKVLEREGIALDMVVSCSGGSMFAAGIAFGDDIASIERVTLNLWTDDLMSGYTSSYGAMSGEIRFTERSGWWIRTLRRTASLPFIRRGA
jgi:predicted acylesterase/phospholipase RssA